MEALDGPLEQSGIESQEMLDAVFESTAVVDRAGVILGVNSHWEQFGADNGGDPTTSGVGVDYLSVCARAARQGNREAELAAGCVRRVLDGDVIEAMMEYECSSPSEFRFFTLRVTVLDRSAAMISHLDVTRRVRAEHDVAVASGSVGRNDIGSTFGLMASLSAQERRVATLLLRGYRVAAIADELFVSPSTVRTQLSSAFRKLGVNSQRGLIDLARADRSARHPLRR